MNFIILFVSTRLWFISAYLVLMLLSNNSSFILAKILSVIMVVTSKATELYCTLRIICTNASTIESQDRSQTELMFNRPVIDAVFVCVG